MRDDRPRWERELRVVFNHLKNRVYPGNLSPGLVLYVSYELAVEIQNDNHYRSNTHTHQINISKNDTTWQGIPLRLDAKLPPGCFIFEEGRI